MMLPVCRSVKKRELRRGGSVSAQLDSPGAVPIVGLGGPWHRPFRPAPANERRPAQMCSVFVQAEAMVCRRQSVSRRSFLVRGRYTNRPQLRGHSK